MAALALLRHFQFQFAAIIFQIYYAFSFLDSITIAVAGHPEGHPSISTMQEDMKFLIEKVNRN